MSEDPDDTAPVGEPRPPAPESADALDLDPFAAADFIRPYVITRGRSAPTRGDIDLVSLVVAIPDIRPRRLLDTEERRVVELCEGGILSVAEVAGLLGLPVGIVRVVLADLVDDGVLRVRPPIPPAELPTIELLQEVLDGLARL